MLDRLLPPGVFVLTLGERPPSPRVRKVIPLVPGSAVLRVEIGAPPGDPLAQLVRGGREARTIGRVRHDHSSPTTTSGLTQSSSLAENT